MTRRPWTGLPTSTPEESVEAGREAQEVHDWVALGWTYQHRHILKRWGWEWSPDARWWEAVGKASDEEIRKARLLAGVRIQKKYDALRERRGA